MGGTTFSAPASIYWRRRFIALVIGLMALSLAAWGLSDALAVGVSQIGQSTHSGPATRPDPSPLLSPSPTATSPHVDPAASG